MNKIENFLSKCVNDKNKLIKLIEFLIGLSLIASFIAGVIVTNYDQENKWTNIIETTSEKTNNFIRIDNEIFEISKLNVSGCIPYWNATECTITNMKTFESRNVYINGSKYNKILKSPQKKLIIGDKVQSTKEYYSYIGETTSWKAWVINIEENGIVYLKIADGTWKGFDGNNFSINEYWIEKIGHDNSNIYYGCKWSD